MAHPSKNTPKNLYYVDTTTQLDAPSGRHFFSITSVDGGTATVTGGGIFEYLAANGGNGTHLAADGTTLGATHDAGYYEALPTTDVDISLGAGQTVFGRFTSVTAGSGDKFLVYA